jgi:diacylglycerol kinase (ATP)
MQARVETVAVLAHKRKTVGGGLPELRRLLAEAGYPDPLWYEVSKSRKASKKARKALKKGARLVFVWGGDGMVQRCVDALAGSTVDIAIIPAGTANLLATNLGIPRDVAEAVRIGLRGRRRLLDLGSVNGEHFAVMAGIGFDGAMIRDAGRGLKDRLGRLAYVWTGLRHIGDATRKATIRLDGDKWFKGDAGCVLLGNVGTVTGGVQVFDEARPDDGWLDVGVATAGNMVEWARTFGRIVANRAEQSPFVQIDRARKVDVRLDKPAAYELDGGDRPPASRLKIRLVPEAITVCVPDSTLPA